MNRLNRIFVKEKCANCEGNTNIATRKQLRTCPERWNIINKERKLVKLEELRGDEYICRGCFKGENHPAGITPPPRPLKRSLTSSSRAPLLPEEPIYENLPPPMDADEDTPRCVVCGNLFKGKRSGRRRQIRSCQKIYQFIWAERIVEQKQPPPFKGTFCDVCYCRYCNKTNTALKNITNNGHLESHIETVPAMSLGVDSQNNAEMNCSPITSQEVNKFRTPGSTHDINLEISLDTPSTSTTKSEVQSKTKKPIKSKCGSRVTLHILTVSLNQYRCIVCGSNSSRVRVSNIARAQIWEQLQIFVPFGARACPTHIHKHSKRFTDNALYIVSSKRSSLKKKVTVKGSTIVRFLNEIGKFVNTGPKLARISMSDPDDFAENDFNIFFGISRDAFLEMHKSCLGYLHNTCARSTYDALAIFLLKMKHNISQSLLASLFNIAQSSVSRCIAKVREALFNSFVPNHLGYSHITREEYIKSWHTVMANKLTGATSSQAIVVVDGTYIYIQKSSNYKVQRQTFSMHKHRSLVKVMMFVAPNGRIIAAEGLFFANQKNNDATILSSISKDPTGFTSFFKPGDYIIFDRGFRDCVGEMKNLGFNTKMPTVVERTRGASKVLTDIEANTTRLVTKIRFVVESANGIIKNKFKFFRDVIHNKYLDRSNAVFEFFCIVCAMINAYCKPLKTNNAEDEQLANIMLHRVALRNELQKKLLDANIKKKTKSWKPVAEVDLNDFPQLSEVDLRNLTVGVYQIRQAPSYIADNLNEEGTLDMYCHKELGGTLILFELRSRNRGAKTHKLFISYKANENTVRGITGYYCMCEIGSRIVGMCSHTAAVIWYLSFARHLDKIPVPAENVCCTVINAPELIYGSESDDDA